MKSLLPVFAMFLFLAAVAGCAHALGYAGSHPGRIHCQGKGSLTATGSIAAGAGIGGTEMNSFTVAGDCGGDAKDGFVFEQGPPLEK